MANASLTNDRVAACTIVSRNYSAYALTLQESMQASNPSIDFYVLVVDRKDPEFEVKSGFDRLVWVEDLGIPNFHHLAFKFDILELNTDVKPFMLTMLAGKYDKVFYLDPDIFVYGSMQGLVDRLKDQTAIITPHAFSPIEDDRKPSEVDFLRAGIYNLGFFGARSCPEGLRLLDWWGRRCLKLGYNDSRQGLFVDQKLVDLIPAFFDGVVIERSPVYNVAYWNLHERRLDVTDTSNPLVNDLPLVFFHFSGLSVELPSEPRLEVSKYQNRSDFRNRPDVKPLFDRYRAKLLERGHRELRGLPYGFGCFSNGERINGVSRRLFGLVNDRFDTAVDPFDVRGPVYCMLAERRALGGGPAQETVSSYTAHKHSRAMRFMERILRLAFRVLGSERYVTLMTYLGHIASLRNQREVFFPEEDSGKAKSVGNGARSPTRTTEL
jgi:hypothetical protein